jgi:hypothetical protein
MSIAQAIREEALCCKQPMGRAHLLQEIAVSFLDWGDCEMWQMDGWTPVWRTFLLLVACALED